MFFIFVFKKSGIICKTLNFDNAYRCIILFEVEKMLLISLPIVVFTA